LIRIPGLTPRALRLRALRALFNADYNFVVLARMVNKDVISTSRCRITTQLPA